MAFLMSIKMDPFTFYKNGLESNVFTQHTQKTLELNNNRKLGLRKGVWVIAPNLAVHLHLCLTFAKHLSIVFIVFLLYLISGI